MTGLALCCLLLSLAIPAQESVRVIPGETVPDENQILEMTTSLDFGVSQSFFTIKPQV